MPVAALRAHFLHHHEQVLHSSLATVSRYAAATRYAEAFAEAESLNALTFDVSTFVAYLRGLEASPNGHPSTKRRRLHDKGVRYICETTRAMFRHGLRAGVLPAGVESPFAAFAVERLVVRDAKPIFVFDETQELAFFAAADAWALPVHFVLAKTGLRPGELAHALIDDVDLDAGWLRVANKPALGWCVKTGRERRVPLVPEVAEVVRRLAAGRPVGPVVVRPRFRGSPPSLTGAYAELGREADERVEAEAARLAAGLGGASGRGCCGGSGRTRAPSTSHGWPSLAKR